MGSYSPRDAFQGGCIRAVGTQLALQYAGSQALHATNSNAAKDFLQSVKRFYRNTFTDVEKQHIIDVFLGVFVPARGAPHIWELESDSHLHNAPPPSLYAPLTMPPGEPQSRQPSPSGGSAEEGGGAGGTGAETTVIGGLDGGGGGGSADEGSDDGGCRSGGGGGGGGGGERGGRGGAREKHALFDDLYAPRGHVSFDRLLSRPFALPFVPKGARLHGSGAGSASGGGDEQHLVSPSGEEAWPDRSSAGDGTAALAAADAALGVPGGRWGAAGYSEGAVELAKVGELPVMLPAGYVTIDEWDRRRRTGSAARRRLSDVYSSLQGALPDEEAYRRYTAPLQAAAVATR